QVGRSSDLQVAVKNTGGGTLAGSVSVPSPFTIVSGGSFSLVGGASQAMVVRFAPSAPGFSSVSLAVTSNGGNIPVPVSGTGVPDIGGTYAGSGSFTEQGCPNPIFNGTFKFLSRVVISLQNGDKFSGSATTKWSAGGQDFVTSYSFVSGTVTPSGAVTGSFTFTTKTSNGQLIGSGSGTFTGSVNGPSFSLSFTGQDDSGL